MEEFFHLIERLGKTEKRVAMATLVATHGTSPRKEGAKMFVSEAGRILGSVTIGGCVDARVIEESEQVLGSSRPRVLTMTLGEEDAWEGGFTCAGSVQVMIEPLSFLTDDEVLNSYRSTYDEAAKGRRVVLATRLGEGFPRLVLFEDGSARGTLGRASLDEQARAIAKDLVDKQVSRTVALKDDASSPEVFFEVHGPPPTLIVFGAVHVAMHLVNLAGELGLKTVVVDARPRFATWERFPNTDELLIGIPSEIAEKLVYSSSTLVVLAAHDYKYDIPVLKTVLKTPAAYVGLLGSKNRGGAIMEYLRASGVDERSLARVRVPTGLDIGAQTAAEIALSILSEAIAVKSGRPGSPMSERR
jgi:xanthine dehydrogenase accessory factor